MTDKEIIIDDYKLEDIKNLLFTGQKMAISTKTFEAIIEQLEAKEQECEELKNNLHIANINHEAAEQECDRYKQALEKIEKIALRYVEAQGRYEILEIINEVKDE